LAKLAALVDDEFAKAMLEDDTYLSNCSSYKFRKEILEIVSRK
jgi:hypothetical protein